MRLGGEKSSNNHTSSSLREFKTDDLRRLVSNWVLFRHSSQKHQAVRQEQSCRPVVWKKHSYNVMFVCVCVCVSFTTGTSRKWKPFIAGWLLNNFILDLMFWVATKLNAVNNEEQDKAKYLKVERWAWALWLLCSWSVLKYEPLCFSCCPPLLHIKDDHHCQSYMCLLIKNINSRCHQGQAVVHQSRQLNPKASGL